MFEGHDLSPAVFIGVAEEFDLIQPIGRWVSRTAIGQLVSWEQAGQALKPISINLSPRQFYDTGLVDFLRDTLELHNLDPSLIEMEITETVLIESAEAAAAIIERLAHGRKIALDFWDRLSVHEVHHGYPCDRIKLDVSCLGTA